jgi:hypothetical protein
MASSTKPDESAQASIQTIKPSHENVGEALLSDTQAPGIVEQITNIEFLTPAPQSNLVYHLHRSIGMRIEQFRERMASRQKVWRVHHALNT